MRKIHNLLGNLLDYLGYLCAVLMVLMLLNVFYDVVMRYLFNNISIAMQELEWHLFAAMFMFGIGYTLKEDGHVRVDVFYDNLSRKTQAVINSVGILVTVFPFSLLIIYFGLGFVEDAFQLGEKSPDPGGLSHFWIIKSVIPLSFLFVIIAACYRLIGELSVLLGAPVEAES
ncbi:TRAP transporter small permease subunit [Shewanella corallii]|uniref:TRAP transporter small permease protein n=1 Tax=Shewanella corallii TaxID=560080 RepID=A0ABT0N3R1_9GAMM|nr:TRAP transporter small permease subunit [Shewanella corallii]MCL2913069.1 TRAP transporter small permease subunit [Shewanella corallii]